MSEQSESIGKLTAALAKVQKEIKAAKKDAFNPFFKSNYADLNAVWGSCRELLAKNELAVIQTTREGAHGTELVTMLAHSSGEWIRGAMKLAPKVWDAQGVGSAMTYFRRYALAAIVGVVSDEDDDGNEATGRNEAGSEPRRPQSPAPTTPPAKSNPPAVKLISEAEAKTLVNECQLRGITGRALLDEIKAHFPHAKRLGDLPADAYNDCYEWIIKQEIPKRDAIEAEVVQYEALGINRETVHAYISSMPGDQTPDMVAKHLVTMRTSYKADALRKMFTDVASRSKTAA